MKNIIISGHRLCIYDSIEEMPIARYHKMNRLLLIDSGIGDTLSDVDTHLSTAAAFLRADDKDSAIKELENMRQGIQLMRKGLHPKDMAFAATIKSIDGEDIEDISDEGLVDIVKRLPDMTVAELASLMEEVKKKIGEELKLYFPGTFNDIEAIEFYSRLRLASLERIRGVAECVDNGKDVRKMEDSLVTYRKPLSFSGSKGAEVEYDRQYERICMVIASELHINAKDMTTTEFYHAIDFLNEKAKRQNKGN